MTPLLLRHTSKGTPHPPHDLRTSFQCRTKDRRLYQRRWRNSEAETSRPAPARLICASSTSTGADDDNPVRVALREAEAAALKAQRSLDNITKLRSARAADQLPPFLKICITVFLYSSAAVTLLASHAHGRQLQVVAAVVTSAFVALFSIRKGSLSISGAMAAFAVGAATQASCIRAPATLYAFFLSSSKLTKLKEELKEDVEDFKPGGQRDWKQVVCTGLVPAVLAVLAGWQVGFVDQSLSTRAAGAYTALMGGFLGYFACCCGDTWASELGQLSQQTPRLITTLRPVRKGTNGGLTWLGSAASLAGGLFIGLAFWASALVSPSLRAQPGAYEAAVRQWPLIPLGLAAGAVGSMLDSLLGATIQFTGFNIKSQKITGKPGPGIVKISGLSFLDNNAVNLVSSTATAAMFAALATLIF